MLAQRPGRDWSDPAVPGERDADGGWSREARYGFSAIVRGLADHTADTCHQGWSGCSLPPKCYTVAEGHLMTV